MVSLSVSQVQSAPEELVLLKSGHRNSVSDSVAVGKARTAKEGLHIAHESDHIWVVSEQRAVRVAV